MILRVAETKPRDVGRGIARLDPKNLEIIGAGVGDIIEIMGKGKTVAKAMPAYAEDRGKGILQIDGLIRRNAQVSLDDKVTVSKTNYTAANKATLNPLIPIKLSSSDQDSSYIRSLIEGLPLLEGDTIRVNLFGTRSQDFTVISTVPKGAVIVNSATKIEIVEEGELGKRQQVSYEDIGGLNKELARLREMVELPLKYPMIFHRLGIDPPKGVLLYGPPGCGKTLIARAIANETSAHFISISGPEIMGKYYGESEARLRAFFEEAKTNAPSILFIDEIDAIAPKREEMGSEKQVERRVVAQLLALMDGLESRGEVVVIGATNIPNSLDNALRRPGRFDREINVVAPNQKGRLNILHIHTRGMPLANDVNLQKISEITHGYVGADLEALCREAAMNALRKIMFEIDFHSEVIPYEILTKLEVTMDDFLEAVKGIEPSCIREVFVEIPEVNWEDVGGLKEVKEKLIEVVQWPIKYAELFAEMNTKPPKGILLVGPPGVGKTLIVKALARESEINFISIKGPELVSKYVGESERAVRELFLKAKQASPCILFFDEFDSLVPKRGKNEASQVTERVISQFLTELDGLEELKGVVVLAATNREDLIDPAILRSGRFDFILKVELPDEETREIIFKVHTRRKPLDDNVDLKSLAQKTNMLSGSDIQLICQEAALSAIRQFVQNREKGLRISLQDFNCAIELLQYQRHKQ
ncbi:MAG: CDC48 family AAA ATPase [Syntrophomonadaceae bacterium]|nr:CDC48 family AAA ATPase [Syntrophomonadaceae bacterium]